MHLQSGADEEIAQQDPHQVLHTERVSCMCTCSTDTLCDVGKTSQDTCSIAARLADWMSNPASGSTAADCQIHYCIVWRSWSRMKAMILGLSACQRRDIQLGACSKLCSLQQVL